MSDFSYSILALDGGGIRGIIPCMLLDKIEKRVEEIRVEKIKAVNPDVEINPNDAKGIAELFDLVAGTSTGGMLGAGLTIKGENGKPKFTAEKLLGLYQGAKAKKIFKKPMGMFNKLRLVTKALFPAKNIEAVLKDEFGEAKLKDSFTNLLITSYDTQNKKPFYFNSRKASQNPDQEDFLIRDVCRSTSAAPTYFPPKAINYRGPDSRTENLSLVDGGVFANNPSALAFVEGMNLWKKDPVYKTQFKEKVIEGGKGIGAEPEPDNFAPPILLISIGTGQTQKKYKHKKRGWGALKVLNVIDILMQGVSESVDFQMNYLLPPFRDANMVEHNRYFRFNIEVPKDHSDMSDTSDKNINALKKIGQDLIDREYQKADKDNNIERVCNLLYEMTSARRRRIRRMAKLNA